MTHLVARAVRKVRRIVDESAAAAERRDHLRAPDAVLSPEQRRFWDENGYLVLEQHFSPQHLKQINGLVDRLWTEQRAASPIVADIYLGTNREQRMFLRDAPADARRHPHKINDLFLEFPEVRGFVLEKRLAGVFAELLGGAPLICNTLNLEFGSQQAFHTDSLYMAAPVDLHLVASWIALEDCGLDAGPLQYYAGSHRIRPHVFSHGRITAIAEEMPAYRAYMQRELDARGAQPVQFAARAGDVFIWHSQLYHGGAAIRNRALTRRSLVTHYWRARDVEARHGQIGRGRYWLVRNHQPVDAPGDDH